MNQVGLINITLDNTTSTVASLNNLAHTSADNIASLTSAVTSINATGLLTADHVAKINTTLASLSSSFNEMVQTVSSISSTVGDNKNALDKLQSTVALYSDSVLRMVNEIAGVKANVSTEVEHRIAADAAFNKSIASAMALAQLVNRSKLTSAVLAGAPAKMADPSKPEIDCATGSFPAGVVCNCVDKAATPSLAMRNWNSVTCSCSDSSAVSAFTAFCTTIQTTV